MTREKPITKYLPILHKVLSLYGWNSKENQGISKQGDTMFIMKYKNHRIRIESICSLRESSLVCSFPPSNLEEGLHKLLKNYFYQSIIEN